MGAMTRLTEPLLAGLALTLLAFGVISDRALAERARRERDTAQAAAVESARLTALSIRAALAQVEQAVAVERPPVGVAVDRLAGMPPLAAQATTVPYSRRSRPELARLLSSTRATPNGLPEAVVARIALGDSPVSLGSQAPPDVGERLLSGRLPVRPHDLPYLAAQLGLGADPRVASLLERLRRAPAGGLPSLPAFRRTRTAQDRVEGWSQAGDDRLFYSIPVATLVGRAGVAERLLAPGAAVGLEAEVPDVAGLTLRVAADAHAGTGGERLRLALWGAVVAGALGLVAVRRALLREAEATAREKAFLAGVTHELRTPLSAIRLFGETLAGGRGDPREYGALVARESERLESLVERVLAVTRVDEAPTFAPVTPTALVASAVALIRPRAERREVTLETRLGAGLPEAQWDEEAVRRALLSLLDNAVTHGRERGHVTVVAVEDSGVVKVSVSDDGPGIARRDRGRIFGRFVRGAKSASGTGLGLHLAEQVARAHGGRIDLATEAGRGSTFTLVLPLVPAAARAGQPGASS